MAIRAEHLRKRYRIGATTGAFRYRSLREDLRKLGRRRSAAETADEVLALDDVSFSIRPGEVVGLIGRNGAGKSTLLKILARITPPSDGSVDIAGRLGSILEVGTGFHPELSGRENIQLSGAVLGMRRQEIAARFNDIVEFAGIGRFLDTPIKRYSSGMYTRLAFAVAAHLEPEILLVDEVLAVGDADFQKKCLGRMEDLGASGRAVVFVSHNMAAVQRLCPRTILLADGRIVDDGPTHRVVRTYLESGLGSTTERTWPDPARAPGNESVRLRAVRVIRPGGGVIADALDIREAVGVQVEYDKLEPDPEKRPAIRLRFNNEEGVTLFEATDSSDPAWQRAPRPPGTVRATCWVPGNFFAEGTVVVDAFINTFDPLTWAAIEHDAVAFDVVDHSDGDGARGSIPGDFHGVLRPKLDWEVASGLRP